MSLRAPIPLIFDEAVPVPPSHANAWVCFLQGH